MFVRFGEEFGAGDVVGGTCVVIAGVKWRNWKSDVTAGVKSCNKTNGVTAHKSKLT